MKKLQLMEYVKKFHKMIRNNNVISTEDRKAAVHLADRFINDEGKSYSLIVLGIAFYTKGDKVNSLYIFEQLINHLEKMINKN
ncbi:hypothetical protein BTS2_3300 [Bacillus sp. TS-2]|nr:hypothetical protein BTS2_3300 [Bacillus sp. TS-2]